MRKDDRLQDALNRETLTLMVHGDAKVGKTTLTSTCPFPILICDAESGSKFLPLRKVSWNPVMGPPPECDGTWDAAVVTITNWDTLAQVYQWLAAGQHCFASLVIDSLTEVQRRLKKNLVGTEQMQMQNWGTMLTRMEDTVTQLRDLTEHPTNPLSVVMFVCETQKRDEKWRPYLQGRMAASLPYKFDIASYLFVADVPDDIDPTVVRKQRQLLVGPDPTIEAGERVQGRLGHIVQEPNVCAMLDAVYTNFT